MREAEAWTARKGQIVKQLTLFRALAMVLASLTGSALLVVGASSSASAKPIKGPPPVINLFTVTSLDSAVNAISTSPIVLYSRGGYVELQSFVSNGTVCEFTANRALPGMPYNAPCTSSASLMVFVPANSGTRAINYNFRAKVIGEGARHAGPITVRVSTTPNPNPSGVTPGSTWNLDAVNQCDGIDGLESFNSDGTFTGGAPVDSNHITISGTYSIVFPSDTLYLYNENGPIAVTFTLQWDPADGMYTGTDNVLNCSYTLTPT
jgi:hypothetical protein